MSVCTARCVSKMCLVRSTLNILAIVVRGRDSERGAKSEAKDVSSIITALAGASR